MIVPPFPVGRTTCQQSTSLEKKLDALQLGPVILTNGAVVHRYESLRVDEDIYTVALALAQCERISIAEAIIRLVRSSGSLFVSPRFETEIGDPCEFALV